MRQIADLESYLLKEERYVEELHSKGYILEHKKTGARIFLLSNDDENKVFCIGFRTPPSDSTGVAHILEHSVLCGSEKFPVKDPFVELVKGSLNTFLNAMTYPDKTVYPVASCNDKDFANLMHVYMDAVFYPDIYKQPNIFYQEGWHYEMENASDELKLNGVVYNEMKGAFSSPDDVLDREIVRNLFPDTIYANESGGDPDVIPNLTYEQFLDFHRKYYHPANSYIYLYGNMDMVERLNWMDEHYLSHFEKIDVEANISLQEPFAAPREAVKPYSITESEPLEHNTYLTCSMTAGDVLNREEYIAFQILDYALCSSQGAPLKQALLDAGIGEDIYSDYDNGTRQPYFSIVAKNADASRKEEFLRIIDETLEKLVAEGLDQKRLQAGLNYYEFKYREADYGIFPAGLMYGLQVMDSWLYDETRPFIHIEAGDTYRSLREKVETGYFEQLIEKYLLHNPHRSVLLLVPERGLTDKKDQELADRLQAYKETLTAEEIEKYINQIAFSGANDFLEKYKNDANAIIGHFGLGFYSAFMVAKKVEIITKSYRDGAQAVKWTCDGSPEFTIEEVDKAGRGSDIILYIDDDCKEFLEESRISELLKKYCSFLPVPIAFGKKKEWKDGKQVETAEDNIINDTTPLWTRKPSELSDEDYKSFYSKLYPMSDEPLFWIHLNVDYPFHLTGILYFPKVKSNIELNKNKIQLYCNQVYVTDSVEGIVPDFLTLLHGVIDSPDIPLNVSRSYLQSDSNVKKISTYITKKVSDRLQSIFKNDRKQFEDKWNDLKIFINYGMLTQEDFYEKAQKFALFTDTDSKHYTFEEYQTLIKDNQTDKDGNLIYLYANNKDEQYSYIEAATNKGYDVLLMDGQLDVAMVSMLEQKFEKSRFTRVDSDVVDNLIVKEDRKSEVLEAGKQDAITIAFKSQLPKMDKVEFNVMTQALGENTAPVMITQSEYMRRMKEMANIQAGMSFYGEMPDMFNLILNSDHKLIKEVLNEEESACQAEVAPIQSEMDAVNKQRNELKDKQKGKKDEDIPTSEKDELNDLDKKWDDLKSKKEAIFVGYASNNKVIRQLIDLALLQNNMLKGEALNNFVKRSIELI